MQQGESMIILTVNEHYYVVNHGVGCGFNYSSPVYSLSEAEDIALLMMTRGGNKDKWVEIQEDNTIVKRWTEIEKDVWKEWLIDGKT